MFKKALPIPVLVFDNWKKYDHILDKKLHKQNKTTKKNSETLNDDVHCAVLKRNKIVLL